MPPEISWKTKGDLNCVLEKRALMTSIMVGVFLSETDTDEFLQNPSIMVV